MILVIPIRILIIPTDSRDSSEIPNGSNENPIGSYKILIDSYENILRFF